MSSDSNRPPLVRTPVSLIPRILSAFDRYRFKICVIHTTLFAGLFHEGLLSAGWSA